MYYIVTFNIVGHGERALHFAGKYVCTYFNFGLELCSAVDGQVGESILHVLIINIKKTFLFPLGTKELVGKDTDL